MRIRKGKEKKKDYMKLNMKTLLVIQVDFNWRKV